MTNGSDRLDRIERILDRVAEGQAEFKESLARIAKIQEEVAARQQYHDEAFERHDAEMKALREAQIADGEHIRALARIAEIHHMRLERLEGGPGA